MTETNQRTERENLIGFLSALQRDISTRTVLFHQAIADQLGLGPTDHKCLDFIVQAEQEAPLTAGELAELTRLTTGAITGVLDRLEAGGFIRREKDPADRRQVRIRVVPERGADVARLFEPLARAWKANCSRYTDEELNLLGRFCHDTVTMLDEQLARIRGTAPPPLEEGISAPLEGVKKGNLIFARGATRVRLVATSEPVLYRLLWNGTPPKVRSDRGEVQIHGDRHGGRVAITSSVPWSVRFRGGAVDVDADLRGLTIEEIEVSGGVSGLQLRLGAPLGNVPLRIRGGAERVTILRPAGVAARVEVRGGAADVTLERLRLGDVGGPLRWSTPDFERARGRYEIEIGGGVSSLSVGAD